MISLQNAFYDYSGYPAGQQLPIHYPLLLTPDALDRLSAWYEAGDFQELVHPYGNLISPPQAPVRVGSLVWPLVGASNFAYAVLPVSASTLAQMRYEAGGGSEAPFGVWLRYEDDPDAVGAAVTVGASGDPDAADETPRKYYMYVIAARPVSQTTAALPAVVSQSLTSGAVTLAATPEDDLWLLTLVDTRWYWVHQTGTAQSPGWTPADWAALFNALVGRCVNTDLGSLVGAGTELPLVSTFDAVDADYGLPGPRWNDRTLESVPVAYALDDAAQCVGQRVVVTPTTIHLQNPSAGNKAVLTDWHAARVAAGRHGGGGTTDDLEALRSIPKQVYAAWPDHSFQVVNHPTGHSTSSGVRPNHRAWLSVTDALSSGGRTAALTQWAADFYAWEQSPVDAVYSGVVPVPDSGFLWGLEVYHDSTACYTRSVGAPHLYQLVRDVPQTQDKRRLVVEEVDGSPSVYDVEKIQFDPADGFVLSGPSSGVAKVKYGFTVAAVGGSPSYTAITGLLFDETDGLTLSTTGGKARVDLTAVYSQARLTSNYTVASTSLSSTGLSVSLPRAGKYRITCGALGEANASALGGAPTQAAAVFLKLYGSVTGYLYPALGTFQVPVANVLTGFMTCFSVIHSASAAEDVTLYASYDAVSTWTTCTIKGAASNDASYLEYERLGD